jgi:GNAT superfamily N-acetyltransferase
MGAIEPTRAKLRDGTATNLRSATADDAAALLSYIVAIYENAEGMISAPEDAPRDEAEERKWVERLSQKPDRVLIIAQHEGLLIGILDFHIGARKRISHRGTLAMSVLPEWRGRGVGTELMDAFFRGWKRARMSAR